MRDDTLNTLCLGGMVIQRTWTAIGSCGNVTVVTQRIIINDQTAPEFSFHLVQCFILSSAMAAT
jgi:hypothetical protein